MPRSPSPSSRSSPTARPRSATSRTCASRRPIASPRSSASCEARRARHGRPRLAAHRARAAARRRDRHLRRPPHGDVVRARRPAHPRRRDPRSRLRAQDLAGLLRGARELALKPAPTGRLSLSWSRGRSLGAGDLRLVEHEHRLAVRDSLSPRRITTFSSRFRRGLDRTCSAARATTSPPTWIVPAVDRDVDALGGVLASGPRAGRPSCPVSRSPRS